MIVVRFMLRSKPDMAEQVMSALKDVISPSRMLEGSSASTSGVI
jgi:hypothetical protein